MKINSDYFKEKYFSIFKKYQHTTFSNLVKRGFCFQYDEDAIGKTDILFIGINPSYDEKNTAFNNSYRKSEVVNISYFKAFFYIADKLLKDYYRTINWSHIDVCVFRETKQSEIGDFLMKQEGGVDFIYQQLMVSKELIGLIKPKAIVVSNTLARRFLGKEMNEEKTSGVWMGYEFVFDKNIGTDVIQNGVLKGTPVFFSSMLSGQRALDNGSKERLIWHLNEVLK